MSLLSLVFALLIEQLRPLSSRKYLNAWLRSYADFFQRNFNAGQIKHGQIAWGLAIALPLFITLAVYWFLAAQHSIFAWAFCVLVLYLTMGFRQFSHYYTDIHKALRNKNLQQARVLLSAWRNEPCDELGTEAVVRLTIEEALLATHRNVFAVVVWFVIFMLLGLGPIGAILYRLARFLNTHWGLAGEPELVNFGCFSVRIYQWLEWLPVRMTAATFAIVGNFEDAVYCWRTQAASWPDAVDGIILSSGAGALGVRLGMPVAQFEMTAERPELGVGDVADVDFMQSAIGLVWRALIFWLILLLLLTLASMASWAAV